MGQRRIKNKFFDGISFDSKLLTTTRIRKAVEKACLSKQIYYSKEEAEKAALYVRSVLGIQLVQPYLCKYCGNFHIGHKY